jgi:hypothetical protein
MTCKEVDEIHSRHGPRLCLVDCIVEASFVGSLGGLAPSSG